MVTDLLADREMSSALQVMRLLQAICIPKSYRTLFLHHLEPFSAALEAHAWFRLITRMHEMTSRMVISDLPLIQPNL